MTPWLRSTSRRIGGLISYARDWLTNRWGLILAFVVVAVATYLTMSLINDARTRWGTDWIWADWADQSSLGGKTIWEWSELLIVPLVLGLGALFFNRQERKNELRIAQERRESDNEIAEKHVQEEVLQKFFDKMSELILDRGLMEVKRIWDEKEELIENGTEIDDKTLENKIPDNLRAVRDMAQIRTVTALRQMNNTRRKILLQFLVDSGLSKFLLVSVSLDNADLSKTKFDFFNLCRAKMNFSNLSESTFHLANLSHATITDAKMDKAKMFNVDLRKTSLYNTDLSKAFMRRAKLDKAFLNKTILIDADLKDSKGIEANFSEANLSNSRLSNVDFSYADLSKANLAGADLSFSNLTGVDLSNANLAGANMANTNLTEAVLTGANLKGVTFFSANLSRTDLSGATLNNAWNEQLFDVRSLEEAKMPDGRRYDPAIHKLFAVPLSQQ